MLVLALTKTCREWLVAKPSSWQLKLAGVQFLEFVSSLRAHVHLKKQSCTVATKTTIQLAHTDMYVYM